MKFVMFYVKDFDPSITQDLLNKALNFANETYIFRNVILMLPHARKSLLFDGYHTWIKKQEVLFDVSVGTYDGAEMCKLAGNVKFII